MWPCILCHLRATPKRVWVVAAYSLLPQGYTKKERGSPPTNHRSKKNWRSAGEQGFHEWLHLWLPTVGAAVGRLTDTPKSEVPLVSFKLQAHIWGHTFKTDGKVASTDGDRRPTHPRAIRNGKKNPLQRQHERTFTGPPSALRSWDLLYFKGWRLVAAGGWWRLEMVGSGWRLAAGGLRGLFLTKKTFGGS